MYLGRLQFACGVQLVCRIMRAAGGSPGIEHYERPDYADRIALLKAQTNYISGFLPALGDGLALAGRVAITAVLLAGVHPALLLLPLLALPSFWAGTRAERVVNAANVATAEQGRLEAHLFGLATTASPAKEVRIFGLADELSDRRRREWDDHHRHCRPGPAAGRPPADGGMAPLRRRLPRRRGPGPGRRRPGRRHCGRRPPRHGPGRPGQRPGRPRAAHRQPLGDGRAGPGPPVLAGGPCPGGHGQGGAGRAGAGADHPRPRHRPRRRVVPTTAAPRCSATSPST